METLKKKLNALTKSAWFASDIRDYLDCSMEQANQIKKATEEKYGAIYLDKHKTQRRVSADNVIKVLGGTDRVTEMQILSIQFNLPVLFTVDGGDYEQL